MYEYKALVKEVYDGDTITIDIELGFGIWMKDQKIRLYGINTPEVRGEEKVQGLVVRDFVRSLILGKEIKIKTLKDAQEKYGRWLGIIMVETSDGLININETLVKKGYAIEYML